MRHCSLCGAEIQDGLQEEWEGEDGDSISISTPAAPCAYVETCVGEVWICESCYSSLPSHFLPSDLHSIHFEFALYFIYRGLLARGEEALGRALAIQRTAAAISALAGIKDSVGDSAQAIALNREALKLDPDCSIARHNLRRLEEATSKD